MTAGSACNDMLLHSPNRPMSLSTSLHSLRFCIVTAPFGNHSGKVRAHRLYRSSMPPSMILTPITPSSTKTHIYCTRYNPPHTYHFIPLYPTCILLHFLSLLFSSSRTVWRIPLPVLFLFRMACLTLVRPSCERSNSALMGLCQICPLQPISAKQESPICS